MPGGGSKATTEVVVDIPEEKSAVELQSVNHIITLDVDLANCPEFNGIGQYLAPGETVVFPDDFGSMARKLHHLTSLGLLEFVTDAEAATAPSRVSWSQMLATIQFKAFLSGEISRKDGFADAFHRNAKMGRAPWRESTFKRYQQGVRDRLTEFAGLVECAKDSATARRQLEGIPTRQVEEVGDTVFDREGSLGDAATLVLHRIMGEHITTTLGNHELGLIGLFQTLDRELTIEESLTDRLSAQGKQHYDWLMASLPKRLDQQSLTRLFRKLNSQTLRELIQHIDRQDSPTAAQQTIRDCALEFRRAHQTIPAEGSLPYYASTLSIWAVLLPAEGEAIGEDGKYSDEFKTNYQALREQYHHWLTNTKYVQRTGVRGRFILHAPQVGLASRTTEQSIVHDILTPIGYMLRALDHNAKHNLDAEAKTAADDLHRRLQQARSAVSVETLEDSITSQMQILQLINTINQSVLFFIRHNLFVTEETLEIPASHIGLYSTTDVFETQNQVWLGQVKSDYAGAEALESMKMASLRQAVMSEPAIGGLFGMAFWGDGGARPSLLSRSGLQLKVLDTVFGHTSVSGEGTPYPTGIDNARASQDTAFPLRVAKIPAVIRFDLIQDYTQGNYQTLGPKLIRDIAQSAGEHDAVKVVLTTYNADLNTLFATANDPSPEEISDLRNRFVANLERTLRGASESQLAEALLLLSHYLPPVDHQMIDDIRLANRQSRRLLPHQARLAFYMQAFATLSTDFASALPIELALHFIPEGRYDAPLAASIQASDITGWHALVKSTTEQRREFSRINTTWYAKAIAGVAVLPAVGCAYALPILLTDLYFKSRVTEDVELGVGNVYTFGATTAAIMACYTLVELRDKLAARSPRRCLTRLATGLQFLFGSGFSGVGKHLWVNLLMPTFLFAYTAIVFEKMFNPTGGLPPAVNTSGTTAMPESTALATTNAAHSSSSPFGDKYFEYSYPVMLPLSLVGLLHTTASITMACKAPGAITVTGQPRPLGVAGRFELPSITKGSEQAMRLWNNWQNWGANNVITLAGIFGLVSFFISAAGSAQAIAAGAGVATLALMALRLFAFPPEKLQQCMPTISTGTRRIARQLSTALNTLATASSHLYLFTVYFYFFARANFNVNAFDTNDPSTGAWAAWITTAGLLLPTFYADFILDSRQVFLATDDAHAANIGRERALTAISRASSRASSVGSRAGRQASFIAGLARTLTSSQRSVHASPPNSRTALLKKGHSQSIRSTAEEKDTSGTNTIEV